MSNYRVDGKGEIKKVKDLSYTEWATVMNYVEGIPKSARVEIYNRNKKRIKEIDEKLSKTLSGKSSFWQSTDPIGWVFDKYSTKTKELEKERKALADANAQFDKYGCTKHNEKSAILDLVCKKLWIGL